MFIRLNTIAGIVIIGVVIFILKSLTILLVLMGILVMITLIYTYWKKVIDEQIQYLKTAIELIMGFLIESKSPIDFFQLLIAIAVCFYLTTTPDEKMILD